jgi:hypothetical protein
MPTPRSGGGDGGRKMRSKYDNCRYSSLAVDHLRELIANAIPDDCIEWDRGSFPDGYGAIVFEVKTTRPHRVAFWIANGRFAEPFTCHTCDNRICVNPLHLFEGDAFANQGDAKRKGRLVHGAEHHNTRVYGGQCDRIRDLCVAGYTNKEIAAWLNIPSRIVGNQVHREQLRA